MSEQPDNEAWTRYAKALISAMDEVLAEADEELHPLLLETADYWLSVGLAMGTERRKDALRLLFLIEAEERNRAELSADAVAFAAEALEP
ncbi:MAG TPA: hypothetical protein VF972_11280 [Actinomycetota bacterium]